MYTNSGIKTASKGPKIGHAFIIEDRSPSPRIIFLRYRNAYEAIHDCYLYFVCNLAREI